MSQRVTQVKWLGIVVLSVAGIVAACSDGTLAPITGSLQLTVTTSGVDLDPDGYAVTLDSGQAYALPANGTLVLDSVYAGSHLLTVQGLTANCSAANNPRTVTVPSGGSLAVSIAVTCVSNTGLVSIWMQTTGESPDPDGYTLNVDSVPVMHVPSNGGVSLGPLAVGPHTLTLSGVAGNCTVATPSVAVVVSRTMLEQVTFDVTCGSTTGSIRVSATTQGSDLDPDGYAVVIDGEEAGQVPANGTVTISGVTPGARLVALDGVAWNCTVGSSPGTVTVTAAQQTTADFTLTCAAAPSLRLVTTSTGVDLDANGYWVTIADSAFTGAQVAANGDSVLGPVRPGTHGVSLADVAGNCQVTGSASQSASFTAAETTTVTFDVSCAQAPVIAFVREDATGLATLHIDGTSLLPLTADNDYAPAWSPDGTRLAFLRWQDCGGSSCMHTFVMSADGTGAVDILPGVAGTAPAWLAWKPDGSRIAFAGTYNHASGLYQMNPDGSNVTLIMAGIGLGHPSWSPDGSRLVMECTVETGNADLCTVNADGTGFQRLTSDAAQEYQPAWSPDGTRILYLAGGSVPGIAVMNADGSGVTTVVRDYYAEWPAWAPDGRHIAFVELGDCLTSGCWPDAIIVANADGSGSVAVNYAGTEPAWRP
jgi:hypothetical protein